MTGSVGKTSVTRAIALGLSRAGKAHASVKSYNNHIGVPLTLARMPADAERAVFEVGMNHAGEITPLSHLVAPHVAVITNVGPVHTENFPDGVAGIVRAKSEIFAGLLPDGVAVLPGDSPWIEQLRSAAARAGARVVTFGASPACDARLIAFKPPLVEAVLHGQPVRYALRQKGDHWGETSLCILLALEAMAVDIALAIEALEAFEPLEGRGAERQIAGFMLIDESYNANPLSMASAIRALGARDVAGRRIAVLTDMLELGKDGPELHAALAEQLDDAGIDKVYCAGPLMAHLWSALPRQMRGGYGEDAAALAPQVMEAVAPGDAVMVKGSNGSRAHRIAQALMNLETTGAGGGEG